MLTFRGCEGVWSKPGRRADVSTFISLTSNFGAEYTHTVQPLAGYCSDVLLVELTVLNLLGPVVTHCWWRSQFLTY